MQRRRGLVSQPIPAKIPAHGEDRKRGRFESDLDSVSSDSSGLSSGLSELEAEFRAKSNEPSATEPEPENSGGLVEITEHPESPRQGKGKAKPPRRKEKKPDDNDTRWQKMKIKGSDKEMLVDMSRVQKYVDLDSVGLTAAVKDVQEVQGNFRQQLADYSDL